MRWGLLFIGMLVASVAHAAGLRDLRLWDGPEQTRVVFDLDAAVEHKMFTLSNPNRVVIDISGLSADAIAKIEAVKGKGLVSEVRGGRRGDGVRVVLDTAQPVFANSFMLPPNDDYGNRLVIDLASPDAEKTDAPPPVATHFEDKPIVVAIDPGHGGEDPGAHGRSGLLEKNVALSVAKRLAKLVDSTPGMKAVLTRDGDYYVGLRERIAIARKNQADLFVSVHCNAFTKRSMHGTAVYVLSDRGATSEHARWLARKENTADLVGGVGLHDKDNELAAVLIDLSQNATMEASFDVGSRILSSMGEINTLQKGELQQAGFVVLKAPDIPSVLVETAFITNPHEEKLLGSSSFQDKLAARIFDGVRGYFRSYRPKQQVVEADPHLQYVSMNGSASGANSAVSVTQGVSQ